MKELVLICGRRGGKTRQLAARSVWTGIRRDWSAVLAPGEKAIIPLIASDKEQASLALSYVKAVLALPELERYGTRELRHSVGPALAMGLEKELPKQRGANAAQKAEK
ncbi:MAG: hypothetical protein ABR998_03520 [Gemmatimonadales bacterium]